jgi:hypothetical protein
MEQLAASLAAAKQEAGMSYKEVFQGVYDRLGTYTPSIETIRAYHLPERISDHPDLVVISAIADVYGTPVRRLAPELDGLVNKARDLLMRAFGCVTPNPHLGLAGA